MFLGVGMLLLGAYQFNQYWATQAVVGPQLAQLEEIDPASLELLGLDAAYLESVKESVSVTSAVLLQTALADAVLGAIFVFAGVSLSPKK
ncbi:hypothetical protein COX85_00280 [Candidatus Micrarchaeota archaeon CG_4_10_14_0_2_um_filter_55_9]|nr:MAG: hypothetical protein AUJ15_01295 [Candidatus Micrarchaeota archaeon CG1_02_55_41]PIO02517.1 MAG: hypothetical protein COT57_03505 [Candidatus Micrarchaeota archaeon CG09_land_8_20_14_0_10_55_25]PIZ92111.1 MAG: hypothetical protein COX85_00280 [Candidatus Micrarchaeota archaeon CG_4_10_14_0_2_um_filter_55_9]PJD01095.1 MAG: hypothetical protein COU38_02750 [Candidatus Micrarchaeota archaeon CG10_big_fil_rev_8_21_14_0_10_54_18]